MKCIFRPFISEPGENTSGNYNNLNNPVETQVHEEARDPDNEDKDVDKDKDKYKDKDEDEDDSTLQETEDNHG
jgi:hypothetical protein